MLSVKATPLPTTQRSRSIRCIQQRCCREVSDWFSEKDGHVVMAPEMCSVAVKRQTLSSCDAWLSGTGIDSWLVLCKIHASQVCHQFFPHT